MGLGGRKNPFKYSMTDSGRKALIEGRAEGSLSAGDGGGSSGEAGDGDGPAGGQDFVNHFDERDETTASDKEP